MDLKQKKPQPSALQESYMKHYIRNHFSEYCMHMVLSLSITTFKY